MGNIVDYKKIAFTNRNNKSLSDFQETQLENNLKKTQNTLIEEVQQYIADTHQDLIDDILSGRKDKVILEGVINDFISTSSIEQGFTKNKVIKDIVDVMVGWERLQPLIDDTAITNIFTNEDLEVIKRVKGEDVLTNIKFETDEELEQFIKNIAVRTGEKINRDKCLMDGFDKVNNIRIQAGIYGSPVRKGEVVRKPYFALRKFPARDFKAEDFMENETFNERILDFYKEVIEDSTIAIVGEPDAGKSTHLDFLQSLKDPMRRVIRIEEEAELGFKSKNSVSFESRKTSTEDTRYRYDMAEFAKTATRLAGKDVVVGEIRDRESWYMYRLIDMGYRAVYSVHGTSCRGGLEQTEFLMSLENHNLTHTQLISKICNSVDFVIYMSHRKVVDIAEVKGYDIEKSEPILNYIFTLKTDEHDNFYWEEGNLSKEFREKLLIRKRLKERRV